MAFRRGRMLGVRVLRFEPPTEIERLTDRDELVDVQLWLRRICECCETHDRSARVSDDHDVPAAVCSERFDRGHKPMPNIRALCRVAEECPCTPEPVREERRCQAK